MPINRLKKLSGPGDEDVFLLRDPHREYSHSEVCDLLERAEYLGFDLENGSILENMTVRELAVLVNRVQ